MKKNYIMPQATVVELVEETMIATSPTVDVDYVEGGIDPGENDYVREEVTFPKHDVWEEW